MTVPRHNTTTCDIENNSPSVEKLDQELRRLSSLIGDVETQHKEELTEPSAVIDRARGRPEPRTPPDLPRDRQYFWLELPCGTLELCQAYQDPDNIEPLEWYWAESNRHGEADGIVSDIKAWWPLIDPDGKTKYH